jgi:hypothetical protein
MFTINRDPDVLLKWGAAAIIVAVFGGIYVFSLLNLRQESSRTQELAAANQALSASLQQLQNNVRMLSNKLDAMTTPPPLSAAAPKEPVRSAPVVHPAVRATPHPPVRTAVQEQRLRRIEHKLADQRQEIAATREQADHARQDLETRLNSEHDELSGSIAKNHDQLAALEKRGERSYYEFDLNKSKQFNRVGPLNLSLRGVNVKHKYYDLVMIVDDQQLEKKHVNLYEPLMLTVADRPQPIELVVNNIKNNEVVGYVSEARYKKSELASGPPTPPPNDVKALQRR